MSPSLQIEGFFYLNCGGLSADKGFLTTGFDFNSCFALLLSKGIVMCTTKRHTTIALSTAESDETALCLAVIIGKMDYYFFNENQYHFSNKSIHFSCQQHLINQWENASRHVASSPSLKSCEIWSVIACSLTRKSKFNRFINKASFTTSISTFSKSISRVKF